MPKQKRKNDTPQHPIMRWIRRYFRWLRDDFRSYRPVYFLPVLLMMTLPFLAVMLREFRLDYYYGDSVFFPLAKLIGAEALFGLYILCTSIAMLVFVIRARGLLSMILLTLPLWVYVWLVGMMFITLAADVIERDRLVVDDQIYRVVLIRQDAFDDDGSAEYIIYACDTMGYHCDKIFSRVIYYNCYPRFELKHVDMQLELYQYKNICGPSVRTYQERPILVASIDL